MNLRRAWILGVLMLVGGLGVMSYGQAIRNNPTAYDANVSTPEMMRLVIQARQMQEIGTWVAILGSIIILIAFLFGGRRPASRAQTEIEPETTTKQAQTVRHETYTRESKTNLSHNNKPASRKRKATTSKPTSFAYSKEGFVFTASPEEIRIEEAEGPSYSINISEIDYVEIANNPERIIIITFDEDRFEYEITEPQRKKAVETIEYFVMQYQKAQEEAET